mgnify:CR=1 FL=1
MDKTELKTNLEKLLEQLEQEENDVFKYFVDTFTIDVDDWTDKQNEEYERTIKPLRDAGDNLASAITSLE